MAEKSYGFAIGNLRARENTLLKKSDMTALSSLKSVDELGRALADKGIGDRSSKNDVVGALTQSTQDMWVYLNEIAPDSTVFAPFTVENDFHNLKVVLKGIIRNTDYSSMLLHPENTDVSLMENAVKEKRFDLLDDFLSGAAQRGYEILTSSGDSQLCDGVIDAACMRTKLDMVNAKDFKSDYAAQLVRVSVFFDNMKSALRAAKAQKGGAFLDETLVNTGFISAERVKAAALSGVDALLDIMPLAGAFGTGAAAAYKASPSEYERYCDDYIMLIAKKARFITMGVEPVVGFMMARLYELKNLRIIYSGIKTGLPQEKILGRLRELYG